MEYTEIKQVIDTSVEFPITHDSLVEQLGGVELTAPTGDSVAVGEILNRSGESTYRSTDMLYTTIVGNLGESFIGRKYTDGRGGSQTCPDPRCSPQESL